MPITRRAEFSVSPVCGQKALSLEQNAELYGPAAKPEGHGLYSAAFSDDENRELYGKCGNPHWHGHAHRLDVTALGPVNAASGHVRPVLTAENIVRVIEDRLRAGWAGVFPGGGPRLEGIRLRETKRSVFELKS